MTLKPVTTRFTVEEEAVLARTLELLRQRNPDVVPTRSDAVRFLVASSASALAGDLRVAIAVPPGAVPPKARRERPG